MLNEEFFFSDPLLSAKALAFASYADDSEHDLDITCKIAQDIYQYPDDREPIYYHLDHSPTSLNTFIHLQTEKFRLLIEEFERCVDYLNDWVLEYTIMIQFGENDTLVPADYIFDYFLERVKGDEFSDHRTLIYSEGKKNLETIAVLVRDDRISLEFRKQEIIKLQSDEGLTLCSGGCLARLSDAAENLKNYGEFTPTSLLKAFVAAVAKETALKKESFFRHNYSGRICLLANVLINDYEVHAMNYLLERLKSDLNLHFLTIPNDPHIESIKLYLNERLSDLDRVYTNYLQQFQREINASHLIDFISYQLYEAVLLRFAEGESYQLLQSFIEMELTKLGQDPEFSLGEVFSEDGFLKKNASFRITIAERLLDSEWLDLPSSESDLTYRLYPANLGLSWIKIEGIRQHIVDVIVLEQGFFHLSPIFLNLKNLKLLFQHLNDLYLFFKKLPLSEHKRALECMAAIQFDMNAVVLDKLDESIDFQRFYQFMTTLSEEGCCIFVCCYAELIRLAVSQFLELIDYMDDERTSTQMTNFIILIIKAGFRDFTNLVFKKSLLNNEDTYLKAINFSQVNLTNSVFQTPVMQCQFDKANLQQACFKNSLLSDLSFVGANLFASVFEHTHLQKINFAKANLEATSFQTTLAGYRTPTFLTNLNFEGANLLASNFSSAILKNSSFCNANLEKVNFSSAKLKNINFNQAKLLDSDFEEAELSSICFSKALLRGANFKGAFLDKVDFSYADLRAANLSQVDLSQAQLIAAQLSEAILTGATLTIAQLFELYQQGIREFSEIKLVEELSDKLTQQTLVGAKLSKQAMTYLIEQGFYHFNSENVCPNLSAKPNTFFKC
jgi:uncharacterized protein YjbI with pentapeptide repeats